MTDPYGLDEAFEKLPIPAGRKRATITPAAFAALPAKAVPCGFFTLTLSDGSRKRFRVRLERGKFLTGRRTLARYCKLGADDDEENEWEAVAVVEPDCFLMFKRWKNQREARWAKVLWQLLHGEAVDGYAVEVEPRCWLCMRELTTPEQLASGLTPGCEKSVSPR